MLTEWTTRWKPRVLILKISSVTQWHIWNCTVLRAALHWLHLTVAVYVRVFSLHCGVRTLRVSRFLLLPSYLSSLFLAFVKRFRKTIWKTYIALIICVCLSSCHSSFLRKFVCRFQRCLKSHKCKNNFPWLVSHRYFMPSWCWYQNVSSLR